MWHEARKQERKIRGMLVDYRKRAERRQDFYEKIKADPTQFMQIHGRKCKIHLDPAVAAAGESPAIMMPWQGHQDNMIDRFDVRAHLDYISPPTKPSNTCSTSTAAIGEDEPSTEERSCNYERYRILAQNDFIGISEEKFLHQLYLEEQFGANATLELEKSKKKVPTGGAAIAYTYEDSDSMPFMHTIQAIQPSTTAATAKEEGDSDSDLDVDVSIDISKLDTTQAHELNACGRNYGMKSNDFYSFLTKDADEAETLRIAREEEAEKILLSGRKSRRERRAQRDRRVPGRPLSPPSYAAKEEPDPRLDDEKNDSDSRSPSPDNAGKVIYITSFGGEDELQPHTKISINFNSKNSIPKFPENSLGSLTYAEKVKQNLEKLKKINNLASGVDSSSRRRRSNTRSRSRSRSRNRRFGRSRRSRSNHKNRRRSRSRSGSIDRYKRRRKTRSRSNHRRPQKYSRGSSSESRSPRPRRKRSSSRTNLPSVNTSESQSPTKRTVNLATLFPTLLPVLKSSPTKSPTKEKTVQQEQVIPELIQPKEEPPPIKRYYGRRKEDQSSSSEDTDDDAQTESNTNTLISPKNDKSQVQQQIAITLSSMFGKSSTVQSSESKNTIGSSGGGTGGTGTQVASSGPSTKTNPRDRLKKKMQILLNKQYRADKKAEIERTERQIQQQQEREDEMRELALKLRRRQRELRHKYGTPTTSQSRSNSKSKSRSKSTSPSNGVVSEHNNIVIKKRARLIRSPHHDSAGGGSNRSRSRSRSANRYRSSIRRDRSRDRSRDRHRDRDRDRDRGARRTSRDRGGDRFGESTRRRERSRSRSRSKYRDSNRNRDRSRDRERGDRDRGDRDNKNRDRDRDRNRERDRERERDRDRDKDRDRGRNRDRDKDREATKVQSNRRLVDY